MSEITKAIRFSDDDWNIISAFLKENPFFDFSSLARMAIQEFVRNPKIEVKAVPTERFARFVKSAELEKTIRGPNG